MFRMAVCALVTALSLAGASAARAAIIVIEAGGVVRQGYDPTNLFGLGYDLAGQSFTARFTFDTSKGDVMAGDMEFVSYGEPTAGTAVFSINGVDISLASKSGAWLGTGAYAHVAQQTYDADNVYHRVLWVSAPGFQNTIFDAGVQNACGTDVCHGAFELSQSDLATGATTFDANFYLTPTYYRVSSVPEPAAWAMMIVGFGLSGSALRRARRVRAILA